MTNFSQFEFRNQPWFDQNNFEGWNNAIPMKTLVIYCFDPRASDVPEAVAAYFGDEVYPGENILDEAGNRVGHTRTLFTETNGGGRAVSALQSVAVMEYLFNIKNVVVVHHSFCGLTSLTPELFNQEFHDHYHVDVSNLFDPNSIAIMDYEKSIRYDIEMLRSNIAVPKHVNLYGFFYEISSQQLIEVVRDVPGETQA
ncbi:hypothetical protein SNE26_24505 [Mucilaginibacter sp. cycad4]|uniref:hypothetical protein n=1 Tax=Mucilaginibacter sp. cycad4 TaxID=3342096 RepID=UPI002AAB2709|nr:hypothetical protein [Mucilaginibacter gossypii]WPU99178.1 hypothetical protein SNE26_24505 [Mucilaginibacter gossypii]